MIVEHAPPGTRASVAPVWSHFSLNFLSTPVDNYNLSATARLGNDKLLEPSLADPREEGRYEEKLRQLTNSAFYAGRSRTR